MAGCANHNVILTGASPGGVGAPRRPIRELPVADTAGALRASDGGEVPLDAGGKEGFGLSFVKRSVDDELDGKADLTLDPSGLRCTIGFLLRKGIVPERAAAAEGGSDDG